MVERDGGRISVQGACGGRGVVPIKKETANNRLNY